jgi:DNA polymerase-1
MPLTEVLADMEYTGINVSSDYLRTMGEEIKEKLSVLEKEIYELAGCEFNIMSPKQLGEILFVKMELPYPKKIKDNSYSTSKEILDKVAAYSPIIEKILDYRTLSKLYNNYVEGLISEIKQDGKIHTLFNQTLTRTGRLSSSEPNLQNIPARLEYGKLIRKAFYPEKDSIILSSDYSQIELRVFAAMSNAENLIKAFKEGNDIHTKTASDIFNVPLDEVTKDQRRQAKAVNFGILYGISSFGLSEDLNIDVYKAKNFIDNYLKTYPRISEYMKETIASAHQNGYVKTLMNRKRIIEELNNKNYMIRQSGERMALNTPIQGTSADILKKAMVEIYQEFEKRNLKSKMLIQVHDELVFNVLKSEENEVEEIVRNIMENTYKLSVPLVVDINKGTDWYEAK